MIGMRGVDSRRRHRKSASAAWFSCEEIFHEGAPRRKNEENNEKQFRDFRCKPSQRGKTQKSRDEGDNEKNYSVVQHINSFVL